ncbi:prolipoprotein diacylglyceryl transferase [Paenibacillus zeisoli]|uniref:Phosphatidylglycerol--prolipoprotein diacylglyceryl transferase n=1 Tax=Paenibacillus zeisoli TaxID=2496267 RepID=A0A433XD94_9BACL|nr:prolipoprotein diacylglyceryl transferase [Paenibacillus zeisoli]RUT31904.1 prolipoprotein diacylglyceryl transferase [Paenibacillus zeisoli]
MHNDLFTIGPLTIHGYGLMIALGIAAAYVVSVYRAKRQHLEGDHIASLVIWCLVGGIAGAKILFWITQISSIVKDPAILLNFTDGFVVYGGIIGGILAGYLYCRKAKLHFMQYFDLIIPSVALAQGFGRIGCFLAGCCYGQETSGWFGVVFPENSFAPSGVPLIPTQLISSGLDFVLFFVLVLFSRVKKVHGQVAALYLLLYSAGRFVLEFYRGDIIRGNVGLLSTSQFIAMILFVISIGMMVTSLKRPKPEAL